MKKRILILGTSTIICFALIYTLHKICLEQNLKIGNFNRKFEEKNFKKVKEINLAFEVYNFAGFDKNNMFLSSKKLTEIIKYNLITNTFLTKKIFHKNHNSNVIGDSLFSFDPYFRKMYIYDIKTLNLKNEIALNVGFDRALAINKNIILLRSATEKYTKTILSSFNINTRKNSKLKIQLNDSLEIDGGLKTDGYFTFKNSTILFTQYKKGSFYIMNNILNQIKRYSTIDNNQIVEGVKLSVDSSYYFVKPTLNTNLLTTVNSDKIYIVSFVKGKSDKLNEFSKYRMVDVYNLNTGKYLKSFYLPNNGIEKANDFYIHNDKIYLLFNNKISVYELS